MRRLAGDYIHLRGTGDGDYARWLVEYLPRIAIAAQFCDLTRFRILVSRPSAAMAAVLRDSLGLFGIAPDRIEALGPTPVFVQRLVLPLSAGAVSRESIEVLESFPLRVASRPDAPPRIFVAHGAEQTALRDLLQVRGFAAIASETMSFAERIGVFSQAELIVAGEAKDLADAAFAPPGVKAIALGGPIEDADLIGDLLALKKGRLFVAASPDPSALVAALDAAGA
jgi:capsular polysaccharide biosynthesis protein